MREFTLKRLLVIASEAETLSHVRDAADELFVYHQQINEALQNRDVSALSQAVVQSNKTIDKLRFVLQSKRQK